MSSRWLVALLVTAATASGCGKAEQYSVCRIACGDAAMKPPVVDGAVADAPRDMAVVPPPVDMGTPPIDRPIVVDTGPPPVDMAPPVDMTAPEPPRDMTSPPDMGPPPVDRGPPDMGVEAPPPSGLVALYTFNQGSGTVATDTSGNTNNGTIVGGATFSAGQVGSNALSLAGVDGHVDLPDTVSTTLRDSTIACWVRVRTDRAWQRIFDFGSSTMVNMFLTPRSMMGTATPTVRFAITTMGNAMEQIVNGTAILPVGMWKHVAVVLGPAGGALYVDGVVVGTNPALTLRPADLAATNHWIGRSQYTPDPYFDGEIDDFRIYSRALSAAEVMALFTQR
jgi:hypothetical protein